MSESTYTLLHNQLVFHDSDKTWRWYEAVGPDVTKCIEDYVSLPVDNTTGLPTAYTTTLVNASTVALTAGALGGSMVLTADTAENDGVNMQLTGEAYSFSSSSRLTYFGIRFAINDADQVDAAVGLTITDTSAATAVSDGIFFRTVDESAALEFIVEKDSVESAVAAATLTDATYFTCEFYFDGTLVTAYVNGSSVGSVAYSSASFPNDEYLTPTIAMLTGEAVANTLTVEWMRAIQLQV
jgi:hypothetical protein